MAMTLSTWSFKSTARLFGIGVDAEKVQRFSHLGKGGEPVLPFVFSKREVLHNQDLDRPEIGFCMCFCCKEAVLKALGAPYNFPECEIFPEPEQSRAFSPIEIRIGEELKSHYRIARGFCFFNENSLDGGEIVAVVYLFWN